MAAQKSATSVGMIRIYMIVKKIKKESTNPKRLYRFLFLFCV